MEYQKKEDSYDEYKRYSNTVLKPQEILMDGPVQGYAATEQERESYAPVETMRLKNPEGTFSAGVNKDKEVTMAVTSDATGPLLRGDRSIVSMDSAKRLKGVPDKIYTNSHDEKVSGIVYKEDLAKSPGAMVKTLKEALEDRENAVVEATTPFLLSKQDKEAKKEMEDYLRGSLEQRQYAEYELQKEEYDKLNKKIALKELEEKRLIHNLSAVTEKMKAKAGQLDNDYRRVYQEVFGMAIEDGTEDEEEKDEEENDQEDENQIDGNLNAENSNVENKINHVNG